MSNTFFALLGHHVAQVGEREALANSTFSIDRNDLGFFLWRVHA